MQNTIHAAHTEDPKECFTIRKRVFVQEQGVPMEMEMDEFDDICDHFLAWHDEKPVGCGRIRQWNDVIKFERIATLQDFRGLGIGQCLMMVMEDYARKKYPNRMLMMNAQDTAVSFYEKIGWKIEGDAFIEAGITHFRMLKK
jgi:predicted GNAT family N-acyltransferase